MQIKNRYTGEVILEGEGTIKELIGSNEGVTFREADLRRADLRKAELWGVDLQEADLRRAKIRPDQKDDIIKALGIIVEK